MNANEKFKNMLDEITNKKDKIIENKSSEPNINESQEPNIIEPIEKKQISNKSALKVRFVNKK